MNIEEINREIERLQRLKAGASDPKIERAKNGCSYWHLDEEFDTSLETEQGTSFDSHLADIGNYYLSRDEAERASRHAIFESKVKAYLRALNGGKMCVPIDGLVCHFIDGMGDARSSCFGSSFGHVFKADESEHIKRAIHKFGQERFAFFFRGGL